MNEEICVGNGRVAESDDVEVLAKLAYETYMADAYRDGSTFLWDQLNARQRQHWRASAHAVRNNVLQEALESQERGKKFDPFSTRCPYCGQENSITVTSVTLTQTFQVVQVGVPLQADGFDISDFCNPLLKDLSTQDERVRCDTCGTEFALSELLN